MTSVIDVDTWSPVLRGWVGRPGRAAHIQNSPYQVASNGRSPLAMEAHEGWQELPQGNNIDFSIVQSSSNAIHIKSVVIVELNIKITIALDTVVTV